VRDDVSVADLARALHAHHVDAAAVLTAGGVLAGIATASDVARLLARGEQPDATAVSAVMTVHPTMLPPSETPANALALMRAGGFRHLPVVDAGSGAVLGIVDVLHLAYDAIVRLHNTYAMVPTKRSFLFQRAARETIEKPTLRSFGDMGRYTALMPDHTALDACEALVRNHAAAIIVVDATGVLEGIFTCRDVASRVVSAGRDPAITPLRAVMTPRPDFALPDFTVLECLQRMQACGFRHLPVVDDATQKVVGLVDVLQLASDALAGLAGMSNAEQRKQAAVAGAAVGGAPPPPGASAFPPVDGAAPSAGASAGASGFSSLFSSLFSSGAMDQVAASLPPMTHAEDAANVQARAPRGGAARRSRSPSANSGMRQISTLNAADLARMRMSSQYAPGGGSRGGGQGPVFGGGKRDGDGKAYESITFKFKDCNGEYRRIKVPRVAARGAYDQLVVDVRHRFFNSSSGGVVMVGSIRIKYIDEDGDAVVISSDDDLAACFDECAELNLKTVKLTVTEVQSRRSMTSVPSPVTSHPGSPTNRLSRPAPVPGAVPLPRARRASSSLTGGESVSSRRGSVGGSASVTSPTGGSARSSPGASPSTSRAAEAHQLMMNQHVAEAISKYDEAVRINGSNARALAGRGAAKLINGDTNAAEEDYRTALVLLEDCVQAGRASGDCERTYEMVVVGLVEALIDQRRYEEAGETSRKLDGKPSKAGCADALRDELQGSTRLATTALMSGECGEAMTFFTNAMRVESAYMAASDGSEPRSASLRNGRGKCYVEMGDFDMALEDFEAAASLDPESVAALKGCGKCLIELDQPGRALEAYQKASKLDAADEQVLEQIVTLRKLLPDPAGEKKDAISQLGAMLGGMNLPGSAKPVELAGGAGLPRPSAASRSTSTLSATEGGGTSSLFDKRSKRKKRNAAKRQLANASDS
jgi:CBS domain-containing protein/tetratricopeptide (TPR) repeat protein